MAKKQNAVSFSVGRSNIELIEIGRGAFSTAYIPKKGAKNIVYIAQFAETGDDAKRILSKINALSSSGEIERNVHIPKIEYFATGRSSDSGEQCDMYRMQRYFPISYRANYDFYELLKSLEDIRDDAFGIASETHLPSSKIGAVINREFMKIVEEKDWIPESVKDAFFIFKKYFSKLGGSEWCFDTFFDKNENPKIKNVALDSRGRLVFMDPMFSLVNQDKIEEEEEEEDRLAEEEERRMKNRRRRRSRKTSSRKRRS